MTKKFGPTIKKLQTAINERFDQHITINKQQYYVEDSGKIAEIIIVKQAQPQGKRTIYKELFSSGSDVSIVLFLRDLWYELNGWEVPEDNEEWNEIKRKYKVKQANKQKKGVNAHG